MSYVLNGLYALLILAASPWLIFQAIFRGKYREGFAAKFFGAVPVRNSPRPCVWLHAVSVGEVNLLGVLLNEIAQRRPDVDCVISTTTTTGYVLAAQRYSQHTVFYCPLDFSWAVRRAMRRIRPSLVVLAELELWPNLIRAAREHGSQVAIINSRLSERSYRGYGRVRRWLRPVLDQISLVAIQNDEYAERFRALGIDGNRAFVTGSIKFDGATAERNNPRTQKLRELAGIADDDIVVLAGSTQQPEEQLALDAFRSLTERHPRLRLILVPRHAHRFGEVAALLDRSGQPWQRRSQLLNSDPPSAFPLPPSRLNPEPRTLNPQPRILLVDTIGELGAWWGTASIGFVGGSLQSSRGGQNMIEPAAYGVATCFGPNTQNFRDVVELLLSRDAAVRVHSGEELTQFVRCCLEDPAYAAALGQRAAATVRAQQGATARTWNLLEPLLPKPRVGQSTRPLAA